jgi:EAL domain-containing protein (putative c-di-GMP-specific phosphodiesterase class I)
VRSLGVDYVQGFHIGKPAPLARWLVDRKPAVDRHARRVALLNTLPR